MLCDVLFFRTVIPTLGRKKKKSKGYRNKQVKPATGIVTADPFPSDLGLLCNRIEYSSVTIGFRPMQHTQECTRGAHMHARCMRTRGLVFKLCLLQGIMDPSP